MRELRAHLPYGSINREDVKELLDNLREANVETVFPVSCTGEKGVFRVRPDERLDEAMLSHNEAVAEFERLVDSPPEYLLVVSPNLQRTLFQHSPATPICEHEIVFCEDGLEITVIVSQPQLEELSSRIEQANMSWEILSIGKYQGCSNDATDSLTDRQRDVLLYAYEEGYYDVPRRTTLSDLAGELEIDESTVAEHLRRAENNVFTQVLGA